jgi:hypothetical protein
MDYRDELRRCLQQALLQQADSLPQPPTITPIFRDQTRKPGGGRRPHLAKKNLLAESSLELPEKEFTER